MTQDKDRSAKWLLTHYGDALLRLAGITGFSSWKHRPAEVVAPRRILDGLFELRYPGEDEPTYVLVEIEAYPNRDADRQILDDIAVVLLEYRQVPEVVCLILKPRGQMAQAGRLQRESRSGQVQLAARWPVVQLWQIDAEEIFASGELGLVPLVPLTRMTRDPNEVYADCLMRLQAVPDDPLRSALLAVTKILADFAAVQNANWTRTEELQGGFGMRFMEVVLAEIEQRKENERLQRIAELEKVREEVREEVQQQAIAIGLKMGKAEGKAEGAILGEVVGTTLGKQETVRRIVRARFPEVDPASLELIAAVSEPDALDELAIAAAMCNALEQFLTALAEASAK